MVGCHFCVLASLFFATNACCLLVIRMISSRHRNSMIAAVFLLSLAVGLKPVATRAFVSLRIQGPI